MLRAVYRFFFFSSRRRHTRSDRDWSSDVCSSDLVPLHVLQKGIGQSKLGMGQSEEGLHLLRHIPEGGRDAGLQLGCRFRVVALPKFVLAGGEDKGLFGAKAALTGGRAHAVTKFPAREQ